MGKLEKIKNNISITENDCWEWNSSLDSSGYGQTTYSGKFWKVHRLVYFLTYGEIEKGFVICHNCNNKKCCNPTHLRQDTQKSNIDDRMKDRPHHWTKLTKTQIEEIFELHDSGLGYLNISKKYNVCKSTIAAIIKKRSWNW